MQFDFNSVLRRWWRNQGPARWDNVECLEMTATIGASFTVTNHSPLNHWFDCHPLWIACWPCYCVSALPYRLWRNVIEGVNDTINKLDSGYIVVAHPKQREYKSCDLHIRTPAVLSSQPGESTGATQAVVDSGRQFQALHQQNSSESRLSRFNWGNKFHKRRSYSNLNWGCDCWNKNYLDIVGLLWDPNSP